MLWKIYHTEYGPFLANDWLWAGHGLSKSYTMGCPPVGGDNPQALASGLSYIQVGKHGITILYHLHQCRPVHHEIFHAKVGKGGIIQRSAVAGLVVKY